LHRYSLTQITSVIVVTLGVVITTLSASRQKSKAVAPNVPSPSNSPTYSTASYAMGIIILSVALIFAGLLGLVQDWTFSRYKRLSDSPQNPQFSNGHAAHSPREKSTLGPRVINNTEVPTWQESMFYLHFLAMPLFLFVWKDLLAQFHAVHSGPRIYVPLSLSALFESNPTHAPKDSSSSASLSIPTAYFPLLLNTLTQLLCASGVHRLTGQVSSLTVTLTLVVRKAVSLVISVLLYGGDGKGNVRMWAGGVLVLAGTVGYSIGGRKRAGLMPKQVGAIGNGTDRKEKAE
jgi:UDP-xylose/UDP-N-acetylglucosamine transporter B4